MDRRTLMKTVGATGAAAAGLGAGPDSLPSSTGRSEALAPVVPLGIAAVGIAGAYYAGKQDSDTPEVDTNDVLEDQVYNIATSVADGREPFEKEMRSNFIDRSNDRTPYANAAWQEIRAAVAKAVVDGETQSEAEAAAAEALDRQTSRSIINIVERYNAAMEGMAEAFVLESENSPGVLDTVESSSSGPLAHGDGNPDGSYGTVTPVDATKTSSAGYMLFETPEISLPAPVSDIEGRDNPLTTYTFVTQWDNGDTKQRGLTGGTGWGTWGSNQFSTTLPVLEANHSSLSTKTYLDVSLYISTLQSIQTTYNNITSKLSTYVGNLVTALDQGAIDPADIYSPSDIVNEFSQTDQDARLAAELMAVGASVPDKVGYRAKISHPDLQKDPLWCHLYPMFSVDNPPQLKPAVTITASEYDIAYIGYDSAVDGTFTTEVLSSSSGDLEILDLDGVDNQVDMTDTTFNQTDDTGPIKNPGDIYLGYNETMPDPLQTPWNFTEAIISVDATNSSFTEPVGNISKNSVTDGEQVWLNGTQVETHEEINSIEVMDGVGYSQPVDYVSDETTVSGSEVQAMLEEQRQTIQELDEALASDGGGGFSLPGLDSIGSSIGGLIVLGGAVLLLPQLLGDDN